MKLFNKNKTNMNFPNLLALVGIENPTEAQLAAANAELVTAGITHLALATSASITAGSTAATNLTALQTKYDSLVTEKATVDSNLATANSEITSLKAELASLPGAKHVGTAPTNPEAEVTEEDDDAKAIAELPHNKEAEAFLG